MSNRVINRKPLRRTPIGDKRDLVTLYKRQLQPSGFNSASASFSYFKVASVWGNVETIKGYNPFTGINITEGSSHRVTINWTEFVDTETVLEFNGQYYDIETLDDLEERHLTYVLLCKVRGDKTLLAAT